MLTPQRHLNAARIRADRRRAIIDAATCTALLTLYLAACLTVAEDTGIPVIFGRRATPSAHPARPPPGTSGLGGEIHLNKGKLHD